MTTLLNKYRGCFLGLAVGDALGGPVEFMSRFEIAQRHGGGVRTMIGGGWLKLRPGETTDDTAMARALAESIVEQGSFDCDKVAARYVAWMRTQPKDIGNITRAALQAWTKGLTVPTAALGAHRQMGGKSAGNGTIMRSAPIALRYLYDERRLIDSSRDDGLITHFDPQAWTGSIAVNLMIKYMINGDQPQQAVRKAADRIRREHRAAAEVAQVLGSTRADTSAGSLPTTGYVIDTLRIAVWALLSHETFEEAVMAAVNLGGDADTQGAVTGALAGAYWGYDHIPQRWLDPLFDRDFLLSLADKLFELAEYKRVVV